MYRNKIAFTGEKHWIAKNGKKPLDIQLDQKYNQSDPKVKKMKDLEDLFDAITREIESRQKHLKFLESSDCRDMEAKSGKIGLSEKTMLSTQKSLRPPTQSSGSAITYKSELWSDYYDDSLAYQVKDPS